MRRTRPGPPRTGRQKVAERAQVRRPREALSDLVRSGAAADAAWAGADTLHGAARMLSSPALGRAEDAYDRAARPPTAGSPHARTPATGYASWLGPRRPEYGSRRPGPRAAADDQPGDTHGRRRGSASPSAAPGSGGSGPARRRAATGTTD